MNGHHQGWGVRICGNKGNLYSGDINLSAEHHHLDSLDMDMNEPFVLLDHAQLGVVHHPSLDDNLSSEDPLCVVVRFMIIDGMMYTLHKRNKNSSVCMKCRSNRREKCSVFTCIKVNQDKTVTLGGKHKPSCYRNNGMSVPKALVVMLLPLVWIVLIASISGLSIIVLIKSIVMDLLP